MVPAQYIGEKSNTLKTTQGIAFQWDYSFYCTLHVILLKLLQGTVSKVVLNVTGLSFVPLQYNVLHIFPYRIRTASTRSNDFLSSKYGRLHEQCISMRNAEEHAEDKEEGKKSLNYVP